MDSQEALENMKRYPEQIKPFIDAEIKLSHTWKKNRALEEIWNGCLDIDDTEEMPGQMNLFDFPEVIP